MKGIKVAIASDFLKSFARIPQGRQKKVLQFVNKFRANPASPKINYEKIVGARDKNLHSVRIDKDYRGVVLKPESGNVHLLLRVDHHDKAYAWAANKTYKIHPETGSLQVIEADEAAPDKETAPPDSPPALFARFRDRQLTRLGVPGELLAAVRRIRDKEELDRCSERLPREVYEALYFLSEEIPYEEVIRDLEEFAPAPERVDTEDFDAALDAADSRRRFHVVEEENELMEILNEPLEKWRVFLHPSQRYLALKPWKGPFRVLGGAGTGKTVVAMHRAKWLAGAKFTGEHDRILFTTFTRNLAADIRANLLKICSREEMDRIEVVNLHKWVADFLRRSGYKFEIDYFNKSRPLWSQAADMAPGELNLSHAFYREEWERVIQPQGIRTFAEYAKASRVGRGVRLNRKKRKLAWTVFEEYRTLLNEHNLKESDDAMRDARRVLESKPGILPYRSVVVDEAQDMSMQAFRLLHQIAPPDDEENNLFIVGDAHQRIYQHKVVLSHCGIHIRGRSRKLRINYRTTEETRAWAVGLLTGVDMDDLDGGGDDHKGYKSLLHGAPPRVHEFDTFTREVDFIVEHLSALSREDLKNTCLAARTNKQLEEYAGALTEKGVETAKIRRSRPDDRDKEGLRLATMHRVKGIEFDRVIIAGVNEGIVPYTRGAGESGDAVVKRDARIGERSLLYVAATRAKREVIITCFGRRSPFLEKGGAEGR